MTRRSVATQALVFALSLVALTGFAQGNPVPDGQKTYEQFRASIKRFPYAATNERKERIVKNFPKLRIGMTKKEVAALIGDPDYSGVVLPKRPRNNRWFWDWQYYLAKRSDDTNLLDPNVIVFFGTNGLLSSAVPSNIPGLTQIRHAGPMN